jgi:hypothetical protein
VVGEGGREGGREGRDVNFSRPTHKYTGRGEEHRLVLIEGGREGGRERESVTLPLFPHTSTPAEHTEIYLLREWRRTAAFALVASCCSPSSILFLEPV